MKTNVQERIKRIHEIEQITRESSSVSQLVRWAIDMGCPAMAAVSMEHLFSKAIEPLRKELAEIKADLHSLGYDNERIEEEVTEFIWKEAGYEHE